MRWVLLAAFALRIAVALVLPDQHFDDALSYRDLGRNIELVMPLYPLLVWVVGKAQIVMDVLLSTLTVWLVYALTLEISGNRRAALLSALIACGYPFFLFYAAVGLTETLFITLLLGSLLAWYRGHILAGSMFAVLGVLTRPTLDLLNPILVAWFAPNGRRLRALAIYGSVYVALMSPWWVFNAAKYGEFIRLSPVSGTLLYAGNNPLNQTGGGILGVDWDNSAFVGIASLPERSRAYTQSAVDWIEANPERFLHLAALKFVRFWRLWPYAEAYSGSFYVAVSILSFVPIVVGSLAYLAFCNWRPVIPFLLLGLYLTAVHCAFVSSIRYRLPLEPLMIVLTSVAITYQKPRERHV